jgi:hypothetical protein
VFANDLLIAALQNVPEDVLVTMLLASQVGCMLHSYIHVRHVRNICFSKYGWLPNTWNPLTSNTQYNVRVDHIPEVGNVTSKRNGITCYRFSHALRAIIIKRR